jgi:hypothetical protein
MLFGKNGRAVQYNGTHGNLSVAVLALSAAAIAAGTPVVMGEFDSNITVVDYKVDHGALGSGTSIDLGFSYYGGKEAVEDAVADGLSTASAGSKRMAAAPVEAGEHSALTLTPKGGAITGDVTVTLFYTNA